MKTLVVFDLNGSLVSVMLSDLAGCPTRGSSYFLEGKRYDVSDTVEYLGARTLVDGRQLSGHEKLLAILTAVMGDAMKAMAAVAGMKDIGHSDKPLDSITTGGIIVPEKHVARDFDQVLFVRARLSRSAESLPPLRLSQSALAPDAADGLVADDAELPAATDVNS